MNFYAACMLFAVFLLFIIEDKQASADQWYASFKARSYIDSTLWAKSVARGPLNSGDWKCNLFVAEVFSEAGLSVPQRHWWSFSPIGANEWADEDSTYLNGDSCWELCDSENTNEGDVLAYAGHVGIVTGFSRTTSATEFKVVENDWGFRSYQSPTCWRNVC